MKFSELQEQLKENFGIDHLADIARELGVSPQAVSNWKARDRVPYKYVLEIRKKNQESDIKVSDQRENNISDSNQALSQYSYLQDLEENTVSIIGTLLTIVKHLRIIIIPPIIFCILMTIYVLFIAKPVYESTAKVMTSSSSGVSQAAGIASMFGIKLPGDNSEPTWVYSEIVMSRTFARRMLKRKFDTKKYGPQKTLLQILTYGDQVPTVGIDILTRAVVDGVIGMIKFEKNGSFYDLTIRAPEPVFAQDFATALIEELDAQQREYNKLKTNQARQFIEKRISDTEKELNGAEEILKNFRDRNRRIENSPALLLEQQRLTREVAVLIGVFTTLKQQLETTKIEEVKESSYVIVLDPPEAPLLPSEPKKKQMVILAGFMGIGIGIILSFIKEYVENSNQDDQEKMSQIKSLIIEYLNHFIPRILKNIFKKHL